MLAKSRHPCEHCREEKTKCGKERPACANCTALGVSCKYKLILHWGGRPYKNLRRKSKIPEGLSIVNGVLLMKRCEKSVRDRRHEAEKYPSDSSCQSKMLAVIEPQRTENDATDIFFSSSSILEQPKSFQILDPLCGMSFVKSSDIYYNLWLHFTEQTSKILVAKTEATKGENPFRVTIPNLARRSLTLAKLVLAFGARHRYQLHKQVQDYETSQLLLGEAGKELVDILNSLPNMDGRTGEQTLACILMLAGYCTFFGDRKLRWTIHLGAASYILGNILSHKNDSSGQRSVVVTYSADPSPLFFLMRWFAFMTVMGGLSSAPLANSSALVFDFSALHQQLNSAKYGLNFKDFEYNSGMRIQTLEVLMKVGKLVMIYENKDDFASEKERSLSLAEAIELDYDIMRDLESDEMEKELLAFKDEDKLLLATDLLFSLLGMLQLRRRIMKLPSTSRLVKDLVLRTASVLRDKIPLEAAALRGITSCIFTFGCECITGSGLESLRPLFSSRMEQILTLGIPTTSQARCVMEECWESGCSWWQLCRERNIEPPFGI